MTKMELTLGDRFDDFCDFGLPIFSSSGGQFNFQVSPIGLGYIAAYLKQNGISVDLVDCTFLTKDKALERIRASKPKIIGIQSMFSMKAQSLELARLLEGDCEMLVAGGPLPTTNPEAFLQEFNAVVNGEGEQTMLDLVNASENCEDLSKVRGITYRDEDTGQIRRTRKRDLIATWTFFHFHRGKCLITNPTKTTTRKSLAIQPRQS